jgi:acyl carrier protein
MSVESVVLNILSAQSSRPVADIKETDNIVTDLGFDSLDIVEMFMLAEDELSIEIDEKEMEKAVTVADAIALVKRLAEK